MEQSKRLFAGIQLKHSVLWDSESRNQTNYGISNWPTAILIGADGKIAWVGNPWRNEGSHDQTQRFRSMLEGELRKVKTKN